MEKGWKRAGAACISYGMRRGDGTITAFEVEKPLSHYHGAMMSFDLDAACRSLPQEIKDFPVNLRAFRSVFGASIGSCLLEYRMNQAAVFLRTKREMSVAEIAGRMGYDSPSKFAATFRRKMGMTPMDYRNRLWR